MKVLDRYLIRETLSPFLLALGAFTFLLAIRPMLDQAQTLLSKGVGLAEVGFLLLTLVPQALGVTIPMAFLAGALMGLGRLSGDREAVALLACGVSPLRLLRAMVLLAVIAGGLDMYILMSVVPDANQRFREETFRLLVQQSEGDIKPGLFYQGFPNKILYIRESRPGFGWSGVLLADTSKPGHPVVTLADNGYLDMSDPARREVSIVLPGESVRYVPGDDNAATYDVSLSRDVRIRVPAESVFGEGTLPVERGLAEMHIADLRVAEAKRRAAGLSPHNEIMHRHQMFSFPAACLIFTLVGVALGIHTRKEGKLGGLTLGVGVLFIYYGVMVFAESLTKGGHFPAEWARWVPNIVVGLIGVVALRWRMRSSGGELAIPWPAWLSASPWRAFRRSFAARSKTPPRIAVVIRVPDWALPRPRLLDLYVAKRYLAVVILSFCGFLGLYYIGTLIDRSEHLLKGDGSLELLFKFFYYSTPQYVVYIVPMATLVAVLATIGGMTKTSELTVIRACGVSLYRVAAPLLVLAIVWSAALFLLDDRVLAAANRKAQVIDDTIRGNAQHTLDLTPNASWRADPSGRVYYYAGLNVATRTLRDLTVFQTSPRPFRLLSETTAASATFVDGRWRAQNGWTERFLSGNRTSRETFTVRDIDLVPIENFVAVRNEETDLMTFGELRRHIKDLAHSGFSLSDSQVRLQERISFPLVTIVMTILGVPFGLTTGRRGALYGFGLAIGLFMSYWLLNTFFVAVGQAGLMPAVLAAWAANVLFLAAAGYFVLTVRT